MTLLPNKHVPTNRSLVGIGALILGQLDSPSTISRLWRQVKESRDVGSYQIFVLALDYLYTIGAVDYDQGFLSRSQS